MGERLETYPVKEVEAQSFNHNASRAIAASLMVAGSVFGIGKLAGAEQTRNGHNATTSALLQSHDSNTPSTANLIVEQFNSSASDVISGSVTFLADERIKGFKAIKPSTCVWESTFWNSGRSANGKTMYFKDHNGQICRDANSPTGWVKVAGGITGRDCGNAAKPFGLVPGPIAPGKIEMLTNLNVNAVVRAKATASATAKCENAAGSASASANASAYAFEDINLKAFLEESKSQQEQLSSQVVGEATFKAQVSAQASATAECSTTPTTVETTTTTIAPTPPTTTTTISKGGDPGIGG